MIHQIMLEGPINDNDIYQWISTIEEQEDTD